MFQVSLSEEELIEAAAVWVSKKVGYPVTLLVSEESDDKLPEEVLFDLERVPDSPSPEPLEEKDRSPAATSSGVTPKRPLNPGD